MQRKVVALRALNAASMFLKKQFRVVQNGTKKDDGTLVSEADCGSEERIIQMLKKSFPNDAILSEECGEISGSNEYRWILDPLDGTYNFLAGIPIFGILLALEKGGTVTLSFCIFPMMNEVFVAKRGKGAFLNGKRIHVSPATSLEGGLFLGDGNKDLAFRAIMQDLRPFYSKGCRLRLLGEAPFGMTRVALGTALTSVMRLGKVWDIAAPSLLVEEAGGKVTDFHGNPWSLEPHPILATNGLVHNTVLSMLAGAK